MRKPRFCEACGDDLRRVGWGSRNPFLCPPCDQEQVKCISEGLKKIVERMAEQVARQKEQNDDHERSTRKTGSGSQR